MNILIHGIKEDDNKAWETRDETKAKFNNFVKEGLNIEDPNDIELVDIHRLPQHPVAKFGRRIHRPIIVKLLTIQGKRMIYKSVKNLKVYNDRLKSEQKPQPYVYVSDHLPQSFENQRKVLLPYFREARKHKQKHSGKQKMENTVYTSMEKRLNRGNFNADSAKFTPILGLTTEIAYLM